MTDLIVTYQQRAGDVLYISGDKFDADVLMKHSIVTPEVVEALKKRKELVEATAETMGIAIARRPQSAPWPPRGFTVAYMEEKGWIEKTAAPAAPKAGEPKPRASGVQVKKIDTVELTDEKVAVGTNFLQPSKRGNFIFWTAAAPDGRILRNKMFKSVEDGTAWLEALSTPPASADTSAAEPAPPAPPEEAPDDVQLQPEPGGAEGSGSAEDR